MSLVKAAALCVVALLAAPGGPPTAAAAEAAEAAVDADEAAVQGSALRGSGGAAAACVCDDSCRDGAYWTRTWDGHRWTTTCCACPADPSHDHGHGHDVPRWCQYVPEEYHDDACRGSGHRCQCQSWCRHTPPDTREMIPDCCGCNNTDLPPPDGETPEWCEYVPDRYREDACTGCDCKEWCQDTPGSSWQWNPECCACDEQNATRTTWNSSRGGRPEWCRYVPEEDREEVCSPDGSGCRCRDWCADTPAISRSWNPECCGCEEAPRPHDGLPEWCRYVPEESRGKDCAHGACQCRGWCRETPSVSWGWNPECCACDRGSWPRPGHGGRGNDVPEWCQYVPDEDQHDVCRGHGHSCRCRDWCDMVPRFTYRWNPECCGCDADGERPGQGDDDDDDDDDDVPAWCAYIPEDRRDEHCRGDEACACRSWCADTPEFTHRWHPQCCGCGRGDDHRPGGGHHHGPGGDEGEVPEWCRYIPRPFRPRSCREGRGGDRCRCRRWCLHVPAAERGGMRQCCGCRHSP